MNRSGFIVTDIGGLALTTDEQLWLKEPSLAGIILFSRNYANPTQVQELVRAIKQCNPSLFIMVDQEGGRVQRFRQGFTDLADMRYFGLRLDEKQPEAADALFQAITITAKELQAVGVDINVAPVLDIDFGCSEVIGNRSFGTTADSVIRAASIVIDALHAVGMPVVGKHFPGHGGVDADSHHTLPIDRRDRDDIFSKDLIPFAKLVTQLDAIMPAHVLYPKLDQHPAGFSTFWLQEVLRQQLNYQGVIVSDDLTMAGAAVIGNYNDRAEAALSAGCDLLMVCNNPMGAASIMNAFSDYQNPDAIMRIQHFKSKIKNLVTL